MPTPYNLAFKLSALSLFILTANYTIAAEYSNENYVYNNPQGGTLYPIPTTANTPGSIARNNTVTVNNGYSIVVCGGCAETSSNNTLILNNYQNTYRTLGANGSNLNGNKIIINSSSLYDVFGGEVLYNSTANTRSINNHIELHGTTTIAHTLYGSVRSDPTGSGNNIIINDYTYDIVSGNTLLVRPTTQTITIGPNSAPPGHIALANFSILNFDFSAFPDGDQGTDSGNNPIIGTAALTVNGIANLIPGGYTSNISVTGLNHKAGQLLLIDASERIDFLGELISQGFDTYDFISITPSVINSNTQLIVDYGYNWYFDTTEAHGNFTINGDEIYTLELDLHNRSPAPTNSLGWNGETLNKKGSGTLILADNNDYSGLTTIEDGTLQIGTGGTAGSITSNVANSGVLAFNRSDDIVFNNSISGTGSLTQMGTGQLTLTNPGNNYSGGTNVNSGALLISALNAVGTGVVNNNAQFTFSGVSGDFENTITGTGNVSFSSRIHTSTNPPTNTASAVVLKAGLSADNINIDTGNSATIASSEAFVGNVLNNGELIVNTPSDRVLNNTISGSGSVTQNSNAVLFMTGDSSYSGGTNINNGTVAISSVTALGTGVVNNDATLAFSGATGDFANTILAPQNTPGNSLVQFADGSNVRIMAALAADDVTITAGSSATVTDGQQWTVTNSVNSAGSLFLGDNSTVTSNVDVSGTLAMTGTAVNSLITGNVTNAGNVRLDTDNSLGSHLRIDGNYVGNNGVLSINTQLDDDNSATDLLSISGNASGRTRVNVSNIGGLGDDTVQGIRIIETGNSTADAFFLQGGYVSAGAYDYSLQSLTEASGVNWYLANSDITGGGGGPTYTPNLGSAIANATASNQMFTMRYEDRAGAGQHQLQRKPEDNLWIRYSGGKNSFTSLNKQLHTDGTTSAVQVGIGLPSLLDNDSVDIGLMTGYGRYSGDTVSSRTDRKSSSSTHGFSLGTYATWFSDPERKNGMYVDSWLQWGKFHNRVKGADNNTYTYNSSGVLASIEIGANLEVGQFGAANVWVQPQAQAVYQGVRADTVKEQHGIAVSHGNDNVQLRTGVKTYTDNVTLGDSNIVSRPFIELNYIHNTEPYSSKIDDKTYRAAGGKDIAEVRFGLESQVANDHQLWFNYAYADGGKNYRDQSLHLGWKYDF